jgi:hypothetical protein
VRLGGIGVSRGHSGRCTIDTSAGGAPVLPGSSRSGGEKRAAAELRGDAREPIRRTIPHSKWYSLRSEISVGNFVLA